MGPDALRLWVASVDYTRDVVLSEEVFRSIYTMMNKYRTTFKVMLGLLHQNHASLPLTNVDMVALYQLREAMKGVLAAYQVYDFHKAVAIVNKWINVDFSAFYLEAAKDRLYCGDGGGVIYQLYNGLLQMLAPITPLLITQAWDYNPNWLKDDM
jgi:isoleucyl-tRNA synthetase